MTPIEVILWDIDGTLVHGSGVGRESTRIAMEQIFGTAAGLANHHFGGKTDWQTLVELLGPHGHTEASVLERMPEYARLMGVTMAKLIATFEVYPLPNALELMTELIRRDDLLHGLVTGNVHTTAPVKLHAAGFDPAWFRFGAYGDESTNRNDLPAKAIERAMALVGRDIAAENVLVIGDTPSDVECARAVGAQVCAVMTGFATPEELEASQPDYLIPDLTHFWDTVPLAR